jgi:hypothetical protein
MLRSTLVLLLLLVTCGFASGCQVVAFGVLATYWAAEETSVKLRYGDGPLVGRTLVATEDVTYSDPKPAHVVPGGTLIAVTRSERKSGFLGHGPIRSLFGQVIDAGPAATEFFVAGHRMKRNEDVPWRLVDAKEWDIVPAHIQSRVELDAWEAGERAADDAELLRRLRDRDWGVVARTLLLLRDRPMPSPEFLEVARELQLAHKQSLVRERASLVILHWLASPRPPENTGKAHQPASAAGN